MQNSRNQVHNRGDILTISPNEKEDGKGGRDQSYLLNFWDRFHFQGCLHFWGRHRYLCSLNIFDCLYFLGHLHSWGVFIFWVVFTFCCLLKSKFFIVQRITYNQDLFSKSFVSGADLEKAASGASGAYELLSKITLF